MLMMSTGRSTRQTNEPSRRGSEQRAQGDASVRAPQMLQKVTRSRAFRMVSANCLIDPDSAWTMCREILSAERGPMPGILAKALVRAEIGSGRTAIDT